MTTPELLGFSHRFVPAERPGTPTLLMLHGTGGNEDDLVPLGQGLAPGAAVLSPRGLVVENGMLRFFRRTAEGVFDLDDLIARTYELADFVTAAAAEYGFEPGRVIAAGYSNGANIAASVLLLRPGLLAGAVLLRPMVPLLPATPSDLTGVPVLIAAGRQDTVVPPGQSEELARMLAGYGANTELHWEPGGHALIDADLVAARTWLQPLL